MTTPAQSSPPRNDQPRGTFTALRTPNFRLYFAGSVVSNVGTWMMRVAQDWLVLQPLGYGSVELGLTTALQFLPVMLITPYAGVIADKFPKRRLLQLTQSIMAFFALLQGLFAVTGHSSLAVVYVCALGLGVGAALDQPARSAFVSEMVDRPILTNAIGLNATAFHTGRLIGPALAGLLIAAFGSGQQATGVVILINAVSYLAVIVQLQRMNVTQLHPTERLERTKGALLDGLRYVMGNRVMMFVLVIVLFAGTFGFNFQITSALMATQVFGMGSEEFGLLGTAQAVGSVVGGLLAARRRSIPLWLLFGAAVSFAVFEIVAGSMPTYWLFAACCPFIGFFMVTLLNSSNSKMQLASDGEHRGRVMAIYFTVNQGGTPLGATFIGWVGEAAGPRWTLYVGGALTLFGALLAAGIRAARNNLSASDARR